MNAEPAYTTHHPRWLRRQTSTYWWLGRAAYLAFILRELSSIFVVWSVVLMLLLIRAVSAGEVRYHEFLAWSARPAVVVLNAVTLLFLVFHAITWFNLAPQAMVVHAAGKRVPGSIIAGSNYLAWIVASALIAWLVVGG